MLGAVFVAAATWGHAPDISPCLGASFLVDAANLLPAACPWIGCELVVKTLVLLDSEWKVGSL